VLIQAIALGHVASLPALRAIVRDSFALQSFEPLEAQGWEGAYQRFLGLNLVK
jgi:rhamnulokinase